MKLKENEKPVMYYISQEAYDIIGIASKKLGIRKSYFIDFLVKKHGMNLIEEVSKQVERVGL